MRLMAVVAIGMFALTACQPEPTDESLEAVGQQLYEEKACASCHTIDGSKGVGPTWKGLFGREVTLDDGTELIADETYLRESIARPSAKTVANFKPGLMETVIKPGSLSDQQISALVAYIKSLR